MSRWKFVPCEPDETMLRAALQSTASRLNIPGSALSVNLEKARIRYRAMLESAPANVHMHEVIADIIRRSISAASEDECRIAADAIMNSSAVQ